MSHDEPPMMGKWEKLLFSSMIWVWIGPLILFFFVVLLYTLSGSSTPTTQSAGTRPDNTESGIDSARQSLTRQTNLESCRTALQQINVELNEQPKLRPPALPKEQADWLREQIGLSSEERAEIESTSFTRLDSAHLDRCFLLRDAAHSLEVKSARGKAAGAAGAEAPLHQAERAFAWVMRQVRLRESEGEEAPPAYVLRRGWGTGVERALVFLALLEQLGDPEAAHPELLGCLLEVPDHSGQMIFWACGVVVGDGKDVYVFDPRLGLPLPGPGSKDIATLAALRKQPDLLAQLKFGDKQQYDVTAEQARAAQARLVCPLSALAPRMRYLQEKLLPPTLYVRLGSDAAGALERLRTACGAGADKPTPVMLAKEKTTLLRRFLPLDEGGVDTKFRKERYKRELLPFRNMPAPFGNQERYPPNSPLSQRLLNLFAAPFIGSALDAGRPRDLLLRGRYTSAVPALVSEREYWRNQIEQRANAVDLDKKENEWWEKATRAYAMQARARQPQEREQAEELIKALWKTREAATIYVLLNSGAAAARNAEVAFQLGLCSQEQAEQMQARLDVPGQGASAAAQRLETDKARQAWENALNSWKQLEDEFPAHPDLAAALRLRGRAETMLGDKKVAVITWKALADGKDLSGKALPGNQSTLEKLAARSQVQQLEKP
jgi:hypothetical protein